MTDENGNIILLSDVIESKLIKEKELEFYRDQLIDIQRKIAFLETDLNLTKKIITMIETETVVQVDNSLPLIGSTDS